MCGHQIMHIVGLVNEVVRDIEFDQKPDYNEKVAISYLKCCVKNLKDAKNLLDISDTHKMDANLLDKIGVHKQTI